MKRRLPKKAPYHLNMKLIIYFCVKITIRFQSLVV